MSDEPTDRDVPSGPLSRALDSALDGLLQTGDGEALRASRGRKIQVNAGEMKAEVELVDADRLGVKVRGVRVDRAAPIDVTAEAAALPSRIRSIPDPLVPMEVDAGMGHAVLRTDPNAMRRREFFEVGLHGSGQVEVRRFAVAEDGERRGADWTLSRDQLGRLLDELSGESP